MIVLLINISDLHLISFILDACGTTADCEKIDPNKRCVAGYCKCKLGYKPDYAGKCQQRKDLIHFLYDMLI